jgi:phosphoenolpyruvate carboxykinase (ATP)
MLGYTSKLAQTERGIINPEATFSFAFGAPFMPHKPVIYTDLFKRYITRYKPRIFLVNTGWTGGPPGVGKRIDLKDTRKIVTAAIEGKLDDAEFWHDSIFNLDVPKTCPGVDAKILNPVNTWSDREKYKKKAKELAMMFNLNFKKI